MKKITKYSYKALFTYLLVFIMLVVGFLKLLPLILDVDSYKRDIVYTLKKYTGFDYEINGKVSLELFPYTKVVVSGVYIENVKNSASNKFLEIEEIEIKTSFLSLFKGDFDIKEISILRPRLEYQMFEDGSSNISLLVKKKNKLLSSQDTKDSSKDYIENENDYENLDEELSGADSKKNDSLPEEALDVEEKSKLKEVGNKKGKHEFSISKLPKNMKIRDGLIIYRPNKLSKDTIENINININNLSGQHDYLGSLNYNNADVNFNISTKYSLGSLSYLLAKISGDNFNFTINSLEKQNSKQLEADLKGNIKKLYKFTNTFLPEISIFHKITSSESLDLKGKIFIANKILSFPEISIDSKSIKGKIDGEIIFTSVAEKDTDILIKGDFDKIDIDSLTSEKSEDEKEGYIDYYSYNSHNVKLDDFNFNMPKKISSRLEIKSKEIIYLQNSIKDLFIDIEYFANIISISPLKLTLPGDSKLEFLGSIKHNGVRPSLEGELKIHGSDFRQLLVWLDPELSVIPKDIMKYFILTSDIDMNPNRLNMPGIYFSVDRFLATGDFSLRSVKNSNVIKLDLKADKINFDKYNLTSYLKNFAYKFLNNVGKQDLEVSKLKVMRNNIILNVELSNILFNNNKIEDIEFSSSIVPGLFNLPYINVSSEKANLKASLIVDLNKAKPNLNLNIYSNNFDMSSIIDVDSENDKKLDIEALEENEEEEIIDKFLENSKDKQKSDHDLKEAKEEKVDKKKFTWSNEKFNNFGLGMFEGNIKVFLKQFKNGKNSFSNLQLDSVIDKKVLKIKNLGFNYYGGAVLVKGSISLLSNPVVAMSFVARNVETYFVAKNISEDFNMKGKLYVQGSLNSSGNTPYEFIKNLSSTLAFRGRNIVIEGFDIDRIIYTLPSLYSALDMQEVVKKSMSSGFTEFTVLDGKLFVDNMIIRSKNIDVRTNRSAGLFSGNAELGGFTMKGVAHMNFMPDAYSRINLILKVQGDMLSPEVDVDTKELEDYITEKPLLKN